MRKKFGERLKKLRENNNELQSDLAEEVGVGVSMVSTWENGINYPKVEKLIDIAEYYKVSIDYLLGLTEDKNTNIYNNFGTHNGNVKF